MLTATDCSEANLEIFEAAVESSLPDGGIVEAALTGFDPAASNYDLWKQTHTASMT